MRPDHKDDKGGGRKPSQRPMTDREILLDIRQRQIRTESKLTRLMEKHGVDPDPPRPFPVAEDK